MNKNITGYIISVCLFIVFLTIDFKEHSLVKTILTIILVSLFVIKVFIDIKRTNH